MRCMKLIWRSRLSVVLQLPILSYSPLMNLRIPPALLAQLLMLRTLLAPYLSLGLVVVRRGREWFGSVVIVDMA